jgi:hypothetical protein
VDAEERKKFRRRPRHDRVVGDAADVHRRLATDVRRHAVEGTRLVVPVVEIGR